ncbi:MAG: transglutaminase family protein [Lachnospiraceae bacterium]|nr:transglutaminase family protein [Lachnospiraceae bacterium]
MNRFASRFYEPILAAPAAIATLYIIYPDLGLARPTLAAGLYIIATCLVCALFRFLHGRDRLLLLGAAAIVLLLPALYGLRGTAKGYHYAHRYLWLLPLLAVGCDLCAALCRRFRAARYLAAAGIIACLLYHLVRQEPLPQRCVMLFLAVLLLLFVDETQRLWHKSGHTDHALHLTFVAPFIALWFGLTLLFHASDKPYDWNLFRNILDRMEEFAISLSQMRSRSGPDDVDSYKAGFSEDNASVGDNVKADDKQLLKLERTAGSNTASAYLAGQYCDTMDGLTWRNTVTGDTSECEWDFLETLCSFSRTDHVTDYMQLLELRITYREFSSRYLIAPIKTIPDPELRSSENVTESGRNLLFDSRRGMNDSFVIGSYRLNLLHEVFLDYMRDTAPITEEEWNKTLGSYGHLTGNLPYSGLSEYRARMAAEYLHEIPLSDSVRQFIDEAVGDSDNAFERLMLLSQALSGFTYTTSPGQIPDTVTDASSFLSYFIETRRGYCTHFATAMTLFAWSEGLPARFVYGFHAPVAPTGSSYVTADSAHAWCEVYFENVGWVPFDATPGHGEGSFWSVYSERDRTPWVPTPQPSVVPVTPVATPAAAEAPAPASRARILLFVLLGFAALALFTIPVLLIDRLLVNRRFRRMTAAEQIPVLYRRNNRLLTYLELPLGDDETLSEFRGRILPKLPDDAVTWIPSYETWLYGRDASAEETAAAMQRGNDALTETFREMSPRKYRFCRMINRLL